MLHAIACSDHFEILTTGLCEPQLTIAPHRKHKSYPTLTYRIAMYATQLLKNEFSKIKDFRFIRK